MIGQTLVLVCAAFGLVAGSCFQVNTVSSNPTNLVLPEFNVGSGSSCGSSSGLVGSVVSSGVVAPVVSSQVVTPVVSSQMVTPVVSSGVSSGLVASGVSSGSVLDGLSGVVSSGLSGSLNGPETAPLPVVQAPSVTLPTIESPMVTLSAPAVPAPRVLSSRCVCTKTVVKPQVYQRVVTVPKVQRYFKRTVTPVVENLVYKSRPVNSQNSNVLGGSGVVSGNGMVSGSTVTVGTGVNAGSGVVLGNQVTPVVTRVC